MWFNFDTTDRIGLIVPDPMTFSFTENPNDRPYHLWCENWPQYFVQDETHQWHTRIITGFRNLPLYTFDSAEYESGHDPFRRFDPYEHIPLKRAVRRRIIAREVQRDLWPQTETKRLRNAILAIVRAFPELETEPEISDFLSYSNHIESVIAQYPKEQTDERIDLHEANGTKPQEEVIN